MARSSLNMALLVVSAVFAAAMVQNSAAQTTHVVGDSMGWAIPSTQSYATWAGNQTFTVGDSLSFNFATGTHDVAQVTKGDYDACTSSKPVLMVNTGPATIKLNSSGEYYFICTYTGHCNAGQKLAINVSAAATTNPSPSSQPSSSPSPSPAPQISTPPTSAPASAPSASPPSSVSAPAPSPSGSLVGTYVVGDAMGWTVPAAVGANASAYQIWAANKSFKIGDKLVFNYIAGKHSVAEVRKSEYTSCDTNITALSLYTTPPTVITLNSSGEHYFICTYTGHCSAGQKLAINVTGTAATSPSTSPAGSPTSTAGSPTSSSTTPSSLSPSGSSSTSSPPPAGNSASSLGVAGISAAFLSIFVALLLA